MDLVVSNDTEKAVILAVADALGDEKVKAGKYPHLDTLAQRGQSGYLSTDIRLTGPIEQIMGFGRKTHEDLVADLGELHYAILTENINFEHILELTASNQVVIAQLGSLGDLDSMVSKLLPLIDEKNIAVCVCAGYATSNIPKEFPTPPVVDPSWKVIGPNVIPEFSIEKPYVYVSASKQLTRVDDVKAFDEDDIAVNAGMGAMPMPQLLREFSYYTGSSWKYGA